MFPAGTTFELAEYSLEKGWVPLTPISGAKSQFTDVTEAIAALQADFDHKTLTFQYLTPQIYIAGTDFRLPEKATSIHLTTLLVCLPGEEKRPITREELGMVRLEQSTFQVAVLTPQLTWVHCNELFDQSQDPVSIASLAAMIGNGAFSRGCLAPTARAKSNLKTSGAATVTTILVHDSVGAAVRPITVRELALLKLRDGMAINIA